MPTCVLQPRLQVDLCCLGLLFVSGFVQWDWLSVAEDLPIHFKKEIEKREENERRKKIRKWKEGVITCPLLFCISLSPSTKLVHLTYHYYCFRLFCTIVLPGHQVSSKLGPAVSLAFPLFSSPWVPSLKALSRTPSCQLQQLLVNGMNRSPSWISLTIIAYSFVEVSREIDIYI